MVLCTERRSKLKPNEQTYGGELTTAILQLKHIERNDCKLTVVPGAAAVGI